MDNIAKAAGITKRTLYARYTDKETLFYQVLTWALIQWREVNIDSEIEEDAPLESKLALVGMAILRRELNEKVVALGRIAALQSERFPSLLPRDLSMSWSPRMKTVAAILRHHVAKGDIAVEDIELTGELFISLIIGIPTRLAAFGIYREAKAEEARVEAAVKIFLNGIGKPVKRRRKPL